MQCVTIDIPILNVSGLRVKETGSHTLSYTMLFDTYHMKLTMFWNAMW